MNTRIRLVVFAMVAASLLSFFALKNTYAADLSDDQIGRIKSNCLAIKGSLNQLHATDALLRVNRGQIYESIGSKLMNNFNSRLGNNGLDNKGLIVVTSEYQKALTTFRLDYLSYEKQLSATTRVDCTQDAIGFHTALEDARTKRGLVHDDVIRMNAFIDDYRSAVSDFMLNYERVTGKN